MSVEIPDKLYFKIGEVSKLACVAPHVLRYWESEFDVIEPKRAHSNQRLYRREDVKTVLLIKSLLHQQGYTISGAKKYLIDQDQTTPVAKGREFPDCLGVIKKELLAVKKMLNENR